MNPKLEKCAEFVMRVCTLTVAVMSVLSLCFACVLFTSIFAMSAFAFGSTAALGGQHLQGKAIASVLIGLGCLWSVGTKRLRLYTLAAWFIIVLLGACFGLLTHHETRF